jgi:hypothetical protein
MAAEWRELTDDAKAPFIAETEVHKKRYEGEKKVYMEKKKIIDAEEAAKAKAQADADAKAAKKAEMKAAKDAKKNGTQEPKEAKKPAKDDGKLVGKKRPA